MKLLNYMRPELAFARLDLGRREDVVRLLVERLVETGLTREGDRLLGEVLGREEVETTGIGGGIAIPHARTGAVAGSHVCLATLAAPVPWNSVDGEPVDLVFLLVGHRESPGEQLRILARISKLVRIDGCLRDLRSAQSPAQVLKAVQSAEARHF